MDYASIASLLNFNNYQTYNRKIAHLLGINAAIVLAELISRFEYFYENGQCLQHGTNWIFFETHEKLYERTSLNRKAQDNAINILIEKGLIVKFVKGIPPKRYFLINFEAIIELIKPQAIEQEELKESVLNCPKRENRSVPREHIDVCAGNNSSYIMNPIEEPNKKCPMSEASPPPSVSAEAETLSFFLFKKIQEWKPNIKKPNMTSWFQAMDRLLRIDKRSYDEIHEMILWIQDSDFWKPNILSPEKLRKQFDVIQAQMMNPKKQKETTTPYQWCCKYYKHGKEYSGAECVLNEDGITFQRGMNIQTALFKYPGWKEKLKQISKNMQLPLPQELKNDKI